jgi:hypothetical protein
MNTDRRVEDMKTYHDILDNKQKEIDIIKLDLEKQKLLLEKKEAQKKFRISPRACRREKRWRTRPCL